MARSITITFLLLCSLLVQSQMAYLFVKRGGHNVKTYVEESRITLELQSGQIVRGLITLLKDNTIYINGKPIPVPLVKSVILREKLEKSFHLSANAWLLITGGAALTTLGLTASKQAKFKEALTAGLVIGFAPVLIQYLVSKISFKRKKYIIGKKFHLQILDFHLPRSRGF